MDRSIPKGYNLFVPYVTNPMLSIQYNMKNQVILSINVY